MTVSTGIGGYPQGPIIQVDCYVATNQRFMLGIFVDEFSLGTMEPICSEGAKVLVIIVGRCLIQAGCI